MGSQQLDGEGSIASNTEGEVINGQSKSTEHPVKARFSYIHSPNQSPPESYAR